MPLAPIFLSLSLSLVFVKKNKAQPMTFDPTSHPTYHHLFFLKGEFSFHPSTRTWTQTPRPAPERHGRPNQTDAPLDTQPLTYQVPDGFSTADPWPWRARARCRARAPPRIVEPPRSAAPVEGG